MSVSMVPLTATGPTLSLRYPEPGDARALFALASEPAVTAFFSWRYDTEDDALRWIESRPRAREDGVWLEFAVVHRDEGGVGITGLTAPSRRDRRAVTGTWLGRPWWGTGVNAESKALLAAIAFGPCRLERLAAEVSVENRRS